MKNYSFEKAFSAFDVLEDISTSRIKINYLDGLRGIAVLFVFLSHASNRGQFISPYFNFGGLGLIGVYLFFVLSGFLLTLSILSKKYFDFKNFYLRRLLRICPLYYSLIIGLYISVLIWGHESVKFYPVSFSPGAFFQHLIFYRGDSIMWTIPIEMQFYLILPFIIVLIKRTNKIFGFVFIASMIYGIIQIFQPSFIPTFNAAGKSSAFDVFFCGIACGYITSFNKFPHFYDRHRELFNKLALILFIGIFFITFILFSNNFLGFTYHATYLRFSLPYALIWGIILLSVNQQNRYFAFLQWKWLRTIGITSFSWYLLHLIVIKFVNEYFINISILKFITSFMGCYFLCVITYSLIEKPYLKIRLKGNCERVEFVTNRNNYNKSVISMPPDNIKANL